MYRLLIVDDEEIIADGLTEILGGLGLSGLDICKAYSGNEALGWLRSTRIDIVLSDIRMPGIGGLELLEMIRGNWPRCRIIFLTGYNDFDAVYKAIQSRGVRYLLKSEGYPKVVEAVKQAIRELEQELRADHLLKQANEQRNTLETLAQGDYFRHLLLGNTGDRDDIRAADFRKLKVPLDAARPVLPVIGHLVRSPAASHSYADRQATALAAKFIGDSYLRDKVKCVGIIDRFGDLLWLIQPDDAETFSLSDGELVRFLEGTLELILAACSESLGLEAAFVICQTPVHWGALPDVYDRLRQVQHDRVGDGANLVMTVPAESLTIGVQSRERTRFDKLELLAGHLEAGRREAFLSLLDELSSPILKRQPVDGHQAMELYGAVALVILSYVNRKQLHEHVAAAGLMRFDAHQAWKDGFAYLTRTADTLFALRRSGETRRATGAVAHIRTYIDEHLGEDLSLVNLARRFHFNPSYLSRLFKQEVGLNLSEYIEETRIRQAKALLAGEEWKIQEVGIRVGYDSPHSFTRFFKKMTGMTPQEYRESSRVAGR
jgi:two-component system response regulator YesN